MSLTSIVWCCSHCGKAFIQGAYTEQPKEDCRECNQNEGYYGPDYAKTWDNEATND